MSDTEANLAATGCYSVPPELAPPLPAPPGTLEHRTLRAITRCTSIDEFVTRFARFVEDSSVFMLTATPLAAGTDRQFSFQLADGTVVFQGRGRVMEHRADDEPLLARKGMRLAIVELTPASRDVHRMLLVAGKPAAAYPHPNTIPRDGEPARRPSSPSIPVPPPGPWEEEPTRPGTPTEMAALRPADLAPLEGQGQSTPGSPYTLPANPLAAISDDAPSSLVEYTLHEETGELPFEAMVAPDQPGGTPSASDDSVAELLTRLATLPPVDAPIRDAAPATEHVSVVLALDQPETAISR